MALDHARTQPGHTVERLAPCFRIIDSLTDRSTLHRPADQSFAGSATCALSSKPGQVSGEIPRHRLQASENWQRLDERDLLMRERPSMIGFSFSPGKSAYFAASGRRRRNCSLAALIETLSALNRGPAPLAHLLELLVRGAEKNFGWIGASPLTR